MKRLRRFAETETRFSMLWQTHPDTAEALLEQSQKDVLARYHHYQQLAELSWDAGSGDPTTSREER